MFDFFKKKKEEPLKIYTLNARVGSKVELDVSHLIIADGIKFRNDLPTDYGVLAVSDFELGDTKVSDINIYNDDEDIELLVRVFNDNDIVIYEQIDQEFPDTEELVNSWLNKQFGRFFTSTLCIDDIDYEKQWSSEDFTVNFSHYADHTDNLTDSSYEVTNASLFSREIKDVGSEYIYLTNEEGEMNTYIGIDFNKNAITVD